MGAIPLGEDILLARHGSNIMKFRQDRKNRATVAYLRSGDMDSASNVVATRVMTPAESFSRGAVDYFNDEATVSRQEVRSLVKISLGFTAGIAAIFGGLMFALYKFGGDQAITSLANMGGIQ